LKTLLSLASLTALVVSIGCATDPNKQVRAADAAHTADVQATDKEGSQLAASMEKDHAALDNTHSQQAASLDKKVNDDDAKYVKDREAAGANVIEARRAFRATATTRLEQIDLKATSIEKGRGAKKVETSVAAVRTRAATAKASLSKLDAVSDSDWFASKQALETSLTDIEKDVHDIEQRL
jgi:hypothetical protein